MRTCARIATLVLLGVTMLATALVAPDGAGSQETPEPPVGSSTSTTSSALGPDGAPVEGEEPASSEQPASGDEQDEGLASTPDTFSAQPAEGATGTAIAVEGQGCTLPASTAPGDAVIVSLAAPGAAAPLTTATLPVESDGSWTGTITVPSGTPEGLHDVLARCIAPEQDLVTYGAVAFTVTGQGAPPTGPDADAVPPSTDGVALASGGAPSAEADGTQALPVVGGGAIEPIPSYDPQTTCSPTPKPGTLAFQQLVMNEFPSTGVGSISRSCSSGGTSEHKEGRAWDWGVNVANPSQRNAANAVLDWLLATDGAGNRWAMARRLGIMYIIWNRQMFRMYRPEDGWQPYTGANPHTDHVHFSFTRAGADKQTSFWQALRPSPAAFTSASTQVNGVFTPPITGDFDGDGRHDVFWYGPGSQPDYVWWGNGNRTFTGTSATVTGTYRPTTGDFDGDGRDDILWYAPGATKDTIWFGRADRSFAGANYTVSGTYQPLAGDFNGDGREDVFWYGSGGAFDVTWYGQSDRSFRSAGARVGGVYQPVTADFNGDSRADIFWYGPGSSSDFTWFGGLNGFTGKKIVIGGTYPGAFAADLNGDRAHDIFWYAPGAPQDNIHLGVLNGTFSHQPTNVAGTFLGLPGDFDGNGNEDVLWYGAGSAVDRVWWAS